MNSRRIALFGLAFLASIASLSVWADPARIVEITVPIDTASLPPLLAAAPGIAPDQVWFALGTQTFYRGDRACVITRKIWVWSKPVLSSPGLYRGHLYRLETPATDINNPTCNPTSLGIHADMATATFLNPGDVDTSPENIEGAGIPGIFEIDGTVPDNRLLTFAAAIPAMRKCVRLEAHCPYNIGIHADSHRVYSALKIDKIINIAVASDSAEPAAHYRVTFLGGSSLDEGLTLELRFKGDQIDDVGGSVPGSE